MTNKSTPVPKKPISRIVTMICDHIPQIGKIKEHKFVSTLGAGVTFVKSETQWNGLESFDLTLLPNQVWCAQELRELADECIVLAKYLEKIQK